ncbi:MAG: hypothetical protein K0U23_02465 [Gammaproteobacteria bacterium]|nr:hypothetical protein [Gammaproteobacteria bacterium]
MKLRLAIATLFLGLSSLALADGGYNLTCPSPAQMPDKLVSGTTFSSNGVSWSFHTEPNGSSYQKKPTLEFIGAVGSGVKVSDIQAISCVYIDSDNSWYWIMSNGGNRYLLNPENFTYRGTKDTPACNIPNHSEECTFKLNQ